MKDVRSVIDRIDWWQKIIDYAKYHVSIEKRINELSIEHKSQRERITLMEALTACNNTDNLTEILVNFVEFVPRFPVNVHRIEKEEIRPALNDLQTKYRGLYSVFAEHYKKKDEYYHKIYDMLYELLCDGRKCLVCPEQYLTQDNLLGLKLISSIAHIIANDSFGAQHDVIMTVNDFDKQIFGLESI